ncbi:MAG: GTP-binding protein, partial [Myxococcota bacterium]
QMLLHLQSRWWAAVPRDRWPAGHEELTKKPTWHKRFGDRAQQLVFIGQDMDEEAMRAALDACLLDEKLAVGDSKSWRGRSNPFPPLGAGAS